MCVENRLEQRVLDAIGFDALLQTLDELIRLPSTVGREDEAQQYVAARMESWGLGVDTWELDLEALRQDPAFSMRHQRDRGVGVVGMVPGSGRGRSLILNGHVDVVPAGDVAQWEHPPWEGTISDERVYGRGSTDMKGGLCCALHAVKAVLDAGVRLKGTLFLESVVGEEDGGVGTLACVRRGYQADGAVIMEPTGLKISPAQAGALGFRVTVPGASAHACVRWEGVSAIDKFILLYQELMRLERDRNESLRSALFDNYPLAIPICVGTLQAGEWKSSVPDSLTLEGRFGVAVGEDVSEARRQLEEALSWAAKKDAWLRDHPPRLEWIGGQYEPARIGLGEAIVETMSGVFREVTGRDPALEGMTYASDMCLLVNEGKTPTVLFGPGDIRQAHRPDEYVPIQDLRTVTQILALTIVRFCGHR